LLSFPSILPKIFIPGARNQFHQMAAIGRSKKKSIRGCGCLGKNQVEPKPDKPERIATKALGHKEKMINRRQFMQISGAGTLSLAAGGLGSLLSATSSLAEEHTGSEFEPDLDFSLTARPGRVSIFPGAPAGCGGSRARCLQATARS
jgi:hypothetical protein